MSKSDSISDDAAWAAVLRRDRNLDGQFVTGVLSTGIYCRPSCAARHPSRANVRFFPDAAAAIAAGLRACLRCRPDDLARDEVAIAKALALLEGGEPLALEDLATQVGYAPHHFSRLFKRAIGLTPAAYSRAHRARRAEKALATGASVTEALFDAGYGAPSRFYEDMKGRIGMEPSAWRKGGAGVRIGWVIVETSLGPLLVAATERGICRIAFGQGEADLRERFPYATITRGGEALAGLAARVVALVEAPGQAHDLPLDVRGTAFQEAVWRELRRIPPGETLSYAQLAMRAGNANAVRAAGSACGANPVALAIPCHRVLRGDGSLGGYAWGLDVKAELLRREGK